MTVPAERRATVTLVSDQALVAQTIAMALSTRGWRVVVADPPEVSATAHGHRSGVGLGILMASLDDPLEVAAAMASLGRGAGRWLVVTLRPPGAVWGALIDAGAACVVTGGVDVDRLHTLLRALLLGLETDDAEPDPLQRRECLARWRELEPSTQERLWQLASMSPSELDVLRRLRDGDSVAAIARQTMVAESTVRSRVGSLLRTLGEHGQVGAVSLLTALAHSRLFEPLA